PCTAAQALPVVAFHEGLVVELDDDAVADLAQHLGALRPFAAFAPLTHGLGIDALALLGRHRLDLDRRGAFLRLAVAGGRRSCLLRLRRLSGVARLSAIGRLPLRTNSRLAV